MKCSKLKANECRTLLLIDYPIFKNYLPDVYYCHLKMLAFGITIGEWSNISSKDIEDMEFLLSNFVDNFPYHKRYIVQNIHSVKHFATTVNDFDPLFNYSTFNYESIIGRIISQLHISFYFPLTFHSFTGYLSASIHGTKRIASELISNLHLFKQAYHISKTHCLMSTLSPFIQYLETGNDHCCKQQLSNEPISKDDFNLLYRSISKDTTIKSMKSSMS